MFIVYIYSTNIGTEYFKHGVHSPFLPLQNAVYFIILTYLVPVLFTFYIQGVLILKKNNSGAKRLTFSTQPLRSNTQTGALKLCVHTISTTYVTFLVTYIVEFVHIVCLKNNKNITQFIVETKQQPAVSEPTKHI